MNGRRYLTGVREEAYDPMARTVKLRLIGPVRAYGATATFGQYTEEAVAEARTWLFGLDTGAPVDAGQAGIPSSAPDV